MAPEEKVGTVTGYYANIGVAVIQLTTPCVLASDLWQRALVADELDTPRVE
jgi:nitrate/nitrite transporter NarK